MNDANGWRFIPDVSCVLEDDGGTRPTTIRVQGMSSNREDAAYREKIQAGIKAKLKKLSDKHVEIDDELLPALDWLLQELGLSVQGTPDFKCERTATFLIRPKEEILPLLISMHAKLCELNAKEIALALGAVIDMVTPLQIPSHLCGRVREQVAVDGAVILQRQEELSLRRLWQAGSTA